MPASAGPYAVAGWRLLDTGCQDGASNMAIDEAIMQAVAAGTIPPTLRFYGWTPPCLSLGYAQRWSVVDSAACAERGWDVVRRPTGGRAILHIDELTYSVCVRDDDPRVQGGLLASYRRLSDALATGLELLGLSPARAQPAGGSGAADQGPACFDSPSNFEITVGQRKLVGSAQARRHGIVLQHGSLPLSGDVTRIADALSTSPEKREEIRRRLRESATTLEASLGRHVTYEQAVRCIVEGFAAALNLRLEPGYLTQSETEQVQRIRADKFAAHAWSTRLQ